MRKKLLEKMDLVMILFLFPKDYKKTFGEISKTQKIKMDHRFLAFKKLKKKSIFDEFIFFGSINI